MNSDLVQDAVLRNLQVLAESISRINESLEVTEPEVRWSEINSRRTLLTHGYLAISLDIVWDVVQQDLPGLDAAVQRMRSRQPSA